jgi:hypothetical protein
VLRIELRRSSALTAAGVIGACAFGLITLLTVAFGPTRWWFAMVVNYRSFFAIVAPLALGAGAWIARRDRRGRVEELLASTPRPTWSRALPLAVALAIALAAGYVVALAASGAAGVRPVDAYLPLGALPVIGIGALSLVALGWLGLAIGRLLPSAFTPPLLTVLGFIALVVVPQSLAASAETRPGGYLLIPEMQNPLHIPVSFTTISARVNLLQVLWFTGLAATGVLAFAATSRRARVLALVPAVLGAAVTVPLLPRLASDMYVLDRNAIAPVCTADEPRVCINRVDSDTLPGWVEPGRRALSILDAKLPPGPSRVEVYLWAAPDSIALPGSPACPVGLCPRAARSAETLVFEFAFRGYREVDLAAPAPAEAVWYLLAGAGAGMCANQFLEGSDVDGRYFAARFAVAAWLMGEDLPPDFRLPIGDYNLIRRRASEILDALLALPADVQRDRVLALRDAELTCSPGDRTTILIGDDAQ